MRLTLGVVGSLVATLCTAIADAEIPRVVGGEFVVTCNDRALPRTTQAFRPLGTDLFIQPRSNHLLIRNVGVARRTQDITRSAINSCATLKLQTGCECAPNFMYSIDRTPNDQFFPLLYGLTKIGAPSVWDTVTGSRAVDVAVIDTGVLYTHPDLVANVLPNPGEIAANGIDDDGNGFVDDVYGWDFANNDSNPIDDQGHGTHCAGTIGATGNNSSGVAGVTWETNIVAVKVLDENGSGSLSDVAAGIDYARIRGVDVINLSLGGPSGTSLLFNALKQASDAGIFIAAAAGNDSADNDTTGSFPSNYAVSSSINSMVAVAATDESDELASFSNFGDQTVHLGAPGVDIASTVLANGYAYYSGTSMAAPHVAGAAALIKSANSSLTGAAIKDLILNNLTQVSALQGKSITGGRLNVAAAVAAIGSSPATPSPTPTATPTVTPTDPPGESTPPVESTPSPTPTPTITPEPTEQLALALAKTRFRAGRGRLTVAAFSDTTFESVSGATVGLACQHQRRPTQVAGILVTNQSGSASLSLRVRKGVTQCFAYAESGEDIVYSNVVRIRR